MNSPKTHVLLAGEDLARLIEISTVLDPGEHGLVLAQTPAALRYVEDAAGFRMDAAVVELCGNESVTEFSDLQQQHPHACFVFLVDRMPPHAAIAKAAGRHCVFLAKTESSLAITATLISMLYQRRYEAPEQ